MSGGALRLEGWQIDHNLPITSTKGEKMDLAAQACKCLKSQNRGRAPVAVAANDIWTLSHHACGPVVSGGGFGPQESQGHWLEHEGLLGDASSEGGLGYGPNPMPSLSVWLSQILGHQLVEPQIVMASNISRIQSRESVWGQ